MEAFDVVIAGGAVMGSSTAYHLLADTAFSGSVLVVEKDMTYQRSASALSLASIRQQFSSPGQHPHLALRHRLPEAGGARSSRSTVSGRRSSFHEGGYLYLASEAAARSSSRTRRCRRARAPTSCCSIAAGLAERFPWLNLDGVSVGTWGRSGEGWFDGWGLLQAFRRKARALGAVYREGKVMGVEREGEPRHGGQARGRHAHRLRRASSIAPAPPAGAKSPRSSAPSFPCIEEALGLQLHLPRRGRALPAAHRHDRRLFAPGGHADGARPDVPVRRLAASGGRPRLRRFRGRFLRLRGDGLAGARASRARFRAHQARTRLGLPLRSEPPRPQRHRRPLHASRNAYVALGFSGHGMQQSPAVGRGLAELIVHGRYPTLDLSDIALSAIVENRPLLERNVI